MYRLILILFFTSPTFAQSEKLIWSQDGSALAFCSKDKPIKCFVICNNESVDVSTVELSNLGKIGRYKYEKINTFPLNWESNDSSGCMVWFKTQAWVDGQRYTVKEPVWVSNGKYYGR